MKAKLFLLALFASGAVAALQSTAAETATVAVEASVQGGTSANADVDEAGLGYVMVKYNASPFNSARKAYFKFDLTGRAADTNSPGTFTVSFVNNYKQRVQLWGLNQPYPDFNESITWNTAQANETTSNDLLTNGTFTASRIGGDALIPLSGTTPYSFTLPRLGDYVFNDQIIVVLSGVNDAANNVGGLRIQRSAATLSFELDTGNAPPVISVISNLTLHVNELSGDIPFAIVDDFDPGESFLPVVTVANPAVVPPLSVICFPAGDTNWIISLSGGSQAGSSLITIRVTDSGGKSAERSFTVTVLPDNFPPTISAIPHTNTFLNMPTPPLPFTVTDPEDSPNLVLSGTSSNASLVADADITFAGAGSNRTVTETPLAGQSGVAVIGVAVSDEISTTNTAFAVMVLPTSDAVFCDRFDYADGNLLPLSANFWTLRTAGTTRLEVSGRQGRIRSSSNGESALAPLAFGPYPPGSHAVLYTSFKATWTAAPRNSVGPFLHLNDGGSSGFFAKLYTTTNNAASGSFRIGIANGGNTPTESPVDLALSTTYTIVTRYDVDSATTTLWIDPISEASPGVTASDVLTPVSIVNIGLRENQQMGTILIDDLQVNVAYRPVITRAHRVGEFLEMDFIAGTADTAADFRVGGQPIC